MDDKKNEPNTKTLEDFLVENVPEKEAKSRIIKPVAPVPIKNFSITEEQKVWLFRPKNQNIVDQLLLLREDTRNPSWWTKAGTVASIIAAISGVILLLR